MSDLSNTSDPTVDEIGVLPIPVAIGGTSIEVRVDSTLRSTVLRAFLGRTTQDAAIDELDIPAHPYWLRVSIRALRTYRRLRPAAIGQRCVYDPSCSRYAELAYRQLGFIRGTVATLRRLHRCKPGSGGTDLP